MPCPSLKEALNVVFVSFLISFLSMISITLKDSCFCFDMVGFYHLEGGVRCRAAEGSIIGKHPGAAVFSVGKKYQHFF